MSGTNQCRAPEARVKVYGCCLDLVTHLNQSPQSFYEVLFVCGINIYESEGDEWLQIHQPSKIFRSLTFMTFDTRVTLLKVSIEPELIIVFV